MIKSVKTAIEKYSLIHQGDKVLVGLSGGADSMCLTHILCSMSEELGITVAAAHMNHNIRGEAADSDARLAGEFAEKLGIEFHLHSADVKGYAQKKGISEELAGRELRYEFFGELKERYSYNKIATAHNKNDNAETLLMNFMRGATISGLCGIPIKRGDIIRPLLDISREDIEKYCQMHNLNYATDETNLETVYTRNKIRLNLIPEIESEFNANFINTVTKNAQIISAENAYIDEQAKKAYNEFTSSGVVSLDFINSAHPAIVRRVIMQLICDELGSASDVSSTAIEDIIRLCRVGKSGKCINLPGKITAAIEYGRLVISRPDTEIGEFEYILEENSDVFIPELGAYARLEACTEKEKDGAIYFSVDSGEDIRIRNRRPGDVLRPKGMSGTKKLKNLFIDEKIPRAKRSIIPIITVNGLIACVGTLRYDKNFEFGNKNRCFKVKLIKQEERRIGTKTI